MSDETLTEEQQAKLQAAKAKIAALPRPRMVRVPGGPYDEVFEAGVAALNSDGRDALWCENCGDAFEGPERPCPRPSKGKPYVDCGRGGHMFRLDRPPIMLSDGDGWVGPDGTLYDVVRPESVGDRLRWWISGCDSAGSMPNTRADLHDDPLDERFGGQSLALVAVQHAHAPITCPTSGLACDVCDPSHAVTDLRARVLAALGWVPGAYTDEEIARGVVERGRRALHVQPNRPEDHNDDDWGDDCPPALDAAGNPNPEAWESADPVIMPAIARDLIAEGQAASAEYLARLRRAEQPDAHAQRLPTPNAHPAIVDLVLARPLSPAARAVIEARDAIGQARYGTRLQPFNGRDVARDLTDEAADAVNYAMQGIAEAKDDAARARWERRFAMAVALLEECVGEDLSAQIKLADEIIDEIIEEESSADLAQARMTIDTLKACTAQQAAAINALHSRVAEFGAAIGVPPGEPLDVLIRAAYEVIALQRRVAGLEEERDDANQRVARKVAGKVRRKAGTRLAGATLARGAATAQGNDIAERVARGARGAQRKGGRR